MSSACIHMLEWVFSLYYLFSILFRVCFRYNVEFSYRFWLILLIDYAVDVFFWMRAIQTHPNFFRFRRKASSAVVPSEAVVENTLYMPSGSLKTISPAGSAHRTTRSSAVFHAVTSTYHFLVHDCSASWEIVMLFPIEIVGYLGMSCILYVYRLHGHVF